MASMQESLDFWHQKFKGLEARLKDEKRTAKSGQDEVGQLTKMESKVNGLEQMVKCMYDAYTGIQSDQKAREVIEERMDSIVRQYGNFQ